MNARMIFIVMTSRKRIAAGRLRSTKVAMSDKRDGLKRKRRMDGSKPYIAQHERNELL